MPALKRRLSFLSPKPSQPHYPLFVFLPGMDGTGRLFYRQAERLTQSFDIRCLAIPTDDSSDWEALSLQIINLVKAELEKSPQRHVYLCGESFGGCLALSVALAAPWLFQRIILINPASSFNQRPWLSLGIPITPWIPDFLHQGSSVGLLPFLAVLNRIAPSDRRTLLGAMQSVSQASVSWRLSLLRNFTLDENKLRGLTQPVLLLAGAADRLLPSVEEANRFRRRLPNAQMVVLPESGHACLLEAKLQLYEIMKDQNFLPADITHPCVRKVA
jgi:pimeloyl-ACP methyl ester carboxylesterase